MVKVALEGSEVEDPFQGYKDADIDKVNDVSGSTLIVLGGNVRLL
jgi:hypothetical protein